MTLIDGKPKCNCCGCHVMDTHGARIKVSNAVTPTGPDAKYDSDNWEWICEGCYHSAMMERSSLNLLILARIAGKDIEKAIEAILTKDLK